MLLGVVQVPWTHPPPVGVPLGPRISEDGQASLIGKGPTAVARLGNHPVQVPWTHRVTPSRKRPWQPTPRPLPHCPRNELKNKPSREAIRWPARVAIAGHRDGHPVETSSETLRDTNTWSDQLCGQAPWAPAVSK